MFKAATKSKCLAFLAVITLFSAVIFAGGCNGSSSSAPSGVLSGKVGEAFEEKLRLGDVKVGELNLDLPPAELVIVRKGTAVGDKQLEYLGNALSSDSVVAFEEASKKQLKQFGDMLGTPLDAYGAEDGIYFTAVSTHGGHTHIYLLGKDYEKEFIVSEDVKIIEPTEEEKEKELEEAEKEGDASISGGVEEASGVSSEERKLTDEERKQQVVEYHAEELAKWIKEGIADETELANESRKEVISNIAGNTNSVNELSKCIGATIIGREIFDPRYTVHDGFEKGNFDTPHFVWAPVKPKVMIWSIHKFEDNTDYYYVQYTAVADPSNAELPNYTSYADRKVRDAWLVGWYSYRAQDVEKLFRGNNPRDKNFFWYFSDYIYHGYPEPNYHNSGQLTDRGIYRAWSVTYSAFTKDSFWLNYMKELSTYAVPTDALNNAGLELIKYSPTESTHTEKTVTETSTWNVGGNIGITPQWAKKSQPQSNGLPFAGLMVPIGISAGGGKTTQTSRVVKDCYLYSGVYQMGSKYVSPHVRYEFYDFNDEHRRMSRWHHRHGSMQDDTSLVSRTGFNVVSDWLWRFDSKELRNLTPDQRSFTANFIYTTAGTSDRAGASKVHVGETETFSQKVVLPLPPSLVAQNPKANVFNGSGEKDYTTISTDSKKKTDGVAIQVFSSTEWTVESDQPWCRPQVPQGEWQPADVKLLNLTVDANNSTTQRTADVTFRSKGEKNKYCRVKVIQSAGK
ncbi:MAG: BACON domain-containing protein [Synergistes sp.]|nr:BACON domain-containing protein [Synergistes sp.]